MPKSPPHAPRGKASYKSSPGKSSPGHSVAPSPPGHESVSPTQTAGNIPSPQHGPGASAGSAPQHFQPQLQNYESFTRPPRPEDLKGLPGNYMPYFGQPGMPPQFTERPSQSNVKLEHEQSNQSSPQQQRFAPQYVCSLIFPPILSLLTVLKLVARTIHARQGRAQRTTAHATSVELVRRIGAPARAATNEHARHGSWVALGTTSGWTSHETTAKLGELPWLPTDG